MSTKKRRSKAHLGMVNPRRSKQSPGAFVLRAHGGKLVFKRKWDRLHSAVTLAYEDALDVAIANEVEMDGVLFQVGLSTEGLWFRRVGSERDEAVLSFQDLFTLKSGQGFIPTATPA